MGKVLTDNPPMEQTVITSLGDEPYHLASPVPVLLEKTDVGYMAGFVAGNVWASGSTEDEAVAELTPLLLDFYEASCEDRERLGAAMARQFAELSKYIIPDA